MSLRQFRKTMAFVDETEPIAAAARVMRDAHVGCVAVMRGARLVGVMTDRDLAVRATAENRDPLTTRTSDIATHDPVVVHETDGLETAAARMREHGVRRLPVLDDAGGVVGMVTADDLLSILGRQLGDVCAGLAGNVDADESR